MGASDQLYQQAPANLTRLDPSSAPRYSGSLLRQRDWVKTWRPRFFEVVGDPPFLVSDVMRRDRHDHACVGQNLERTEG